MLSASWSYSYLAPIVVMWIPFCLIANQTVSPVVSPSNIYQAQGLTTSVESKFVPVLVTGNILCVLVPISLPPMMPSFCPGTSLCICFCLLMRVLLRRLSLARFLVCIQAWAQKSLLLRAFVFASYLLSEIILHIIHFLKKCTFSRKFRGPRKMSPVCKRSLLYYMHIYTD